MTSPPPLELNYQPTLPQQRDLPIGCIGSGFIMADCHLVAYAAAGFNPVAIASRTPSHAAEVAQRHGLRSYESYLQMLQEEELQVVDIAVPPDLQLQVIEDVIKHGKNIRGILAQKPLATNYLQACKIVQMCAAAGITLAVNQTCDTTSRYELAETCSIAMPWETLFSPVSTCGPFLTGCPGKNDLAGSPCGSCPSTTWIPSVTG